MVIGKASGKPFETDGLVSTFQEGFDAQSGGRLDTDEQRFGSIAKSGAIVDVVDEARGLVRVVLTSGDVLTGEIQQFTAPVLTITSRVLVLQTEREFAHILPLAQYPPAFVATIVRVNSAGNIPTTAEVRHSLTGLGDNGHFAAPIAAPLLAQINLSLPQALGGAGLTQSANAVMDLQPGDIVLVQTTPRARCVATTQLYANHVIVAKLYDGGA